MPLTEIEVEVETPTSSREPLERFSMPRILQSVLGTSIVRSSARRAEPSRSCCVARGQQPGGARRGRCPAGSPRCPRPPAPASIPVHRILHTGLKALSTVGRMYVAASPVSTHPWAGFGLPGGVGKPGDPGGTVYPVMGSVDGDSVVNIRPGGLVRWPRPADRPPESPLVPDPCRPPCRREFRIPPCPGNECRGRRDLSPIRRRLGQLGPR